MIVILDYGMGNSSSIKNMLKKVGADAHITSDKELIEQASAIILPGVGSFDNGMKKLNELGLIDILNKKVNDGKVPFLGVCLGMQLLLEGSEEGVLPGLGWIPGKSKKIIFSEPVVQKSLKVPHMGWNVVNSKPDSLLYEGLQDEARFYFVHSYKVICDDNNDVLATCDYGGAFACSINRGHIYGAQFHPEKSHRFGIQFFKNFLKVIDNAKN